MESLHLPELPEAPECVAALADLQARLDGELAASDAARLELHLAVCAPCARLARGLTADRAVLASKPPMGLPAGHLEAILRATTGLPSAAPSAPVRTARPRAWLRPLAAAALLTVGASLALWRPWSDRSAPLQPAGEGQVARAPQAPPPTPNSVGPQAANGLSTGAAEQKQPAPAALGQAAGNNPPSSGDSARSPAEMLAASGELQPNPSFPPSAAGLPTAAELPSGLNPAATLTDTHNAVAQAENAINPSLAEPEDLPGEQPDPSAAVAELSAPATQNPIEPEPKWAAGLAWLSGEAATWLLESWDPSEDAGTRPPVDPLASAGAQRQGEAPAALAQPDAQSSLVADAADASSAAGDAGSNPANPPAPIAQAELLASAAQSPVSPPSALEATPAQPAPERDLRGLTAPVSLQRDADGWRLVTQGDVRQIAPALLALLDDRDPQIVALAETRLVALAEDFGDWPVEAEGGLNWWSSVGASRARSTGQTSPAPDASTWRLWWELRSAALGAATL
jgi:hypothetical protein